MAPVYVFVGGVSHTPAFFEPLIEHLSQQNIESTAVAYPTCGENTEKVKQWEEVIHIRKVVTEILDKGSDVILVLHSYGGWPGSRAVKGLDKETRQNQGSLTTGIVEVIFIAAFLLPDNAPMSAYSYLPPWLTVENGRRKPNESCLPLLFSDLEPAAQQHWLSKFEWQRNDFTSAETVPDAPWHLSIPKTYVVTTCDPCATLDFQFQMLQGVMTVRPETWTLKSIAAGHEPFLSQPARLAEVILRPRPAD